MTISTRSRTGLLVPTLLSLCGTLLLAEDAVPVVTPAPVHAAEPGPVADDETLVISTDKDKAGKFDTDWAEATKLDLTLQSTPQTITVIPRELIDSQGFFSLRDALRNAPGLTLGAGEGGVTGDAFSIRGFNASGDIYLDGMKDNGQYFRDTFNIQQVEVLKGPSAVLFGRGSVGGVINQVTRKPGDQLAANLALTGGTDDLFRAAGGVGGPINDYFAGRVDGYIYDANSFRDEIHVNRKGVAPTVSVKINPQSELIFQTFHQREESDIDYGLPRWRGRPANVDVSTFYGFKDDDIQKFDVDQYTVTFKHQFNDKLRLRNASRYSVNSRYYRVNIPSSTVATTNTPTTTGTIYNTDPTLDSTSLSQALRSNDQRSFFNQTDISSEGRLGDRNVQFLGGAEFGREAYDYRNRPSLGVRRVSIFNPQQADSWGIGRADDLSQFSSHTENESTTVAFYGMGVLSLVEQLKVVAGIRWDQYDATSTPNSGVTLGIDGLPAAAPAVTSFNQRDRVWSPRAALIYEPSEEITVYTSYGTAFSPSAEAISSSISATTVNVEPEKSRTLEVGAKANVFDEHLMLSAAVFRIEKYNARGAVDPATGQVTMDGNQRNDGLEIGAAGTLTNWWSVFAGGSLMNATYHNSDLTTTFVDYDAPTVLPGGQITYPTRTVNQEGKHLTNTAKLGGTLWTTFELGAGFTAGGGVYVLGERYINAANTETLPGYVRTDLTVGWSTRAANVSWNVQANVFNVFDIVYYEASHPNFVAPGTPRAGQLTLSADF